MREEGALLFFNPLSNVSYDRKMFLIELFVDFL